MKILSELHQIKCIIHLTRLIQRLVLNSRVAARCGALRWVEIFDYFYKILCMVFLLFFANAAVALYVFRELRLAAYRDRIAAACTSCYAKYRVRTACTSLLITGDQGDKMKNNCVNSESV